MVEEDDDDEASSSWWAEFPFRGFSAMWSGRFLTASDMAASAPLATVGRGRRGSRSGSDSGSGSGSSSGSREDGSPSAGTLHKRETQTTMKYMYLVVLVDKGRYTQKGDIHNYAVHVHAEWKYSTR